MDQNASFDHAIGFDPSTYVIETDYVRPALVALRQKIKFGGIGTRVESNVIPIRDMTLRPTED